MISAMIRVFESVLAGLGAIAGFIFGGFDGLFYALLAFVIIDYISGVFVAISTKKLSSEVGFKGISKKVLVFALIGVANIVDTKILTIGSALRTSTICFYIANEGISIIENAGNLGLPLPKALTKVLVQIKNKEDNDGTD